MPVTKLLKSSVLKEYNHTFSVNLSKLLLDANIALASSIFLVDLIPRFTAKSFSLILGTVVPGKKNNLSLSVGTYLSSLIVRMPLRKAFSFEEEKGSENRSSISEVAISKSDIFLLLWYSLFMCLKLTWSKSFIIIS